MSPSAPQKAPLAAIHGETVAICEKTETAKESSVTANKQPENTNPQGVAMPLDMAYRPVTLQADERFDRVNENIALISKKNGLTFGSDAFLLSAFCRALPRGRAADFGCGTGIIALLLAARHTFAHITGVEVQPTFATLAARNVCLNGLGSQVSVLERDVRTLSPADFGGELDVVIANPPYMRADSGYASPFNEKQIARHEIYGNGTDFVHAAARCLKFGGRYYTVYRPDRLAGLIEDLRGAGLEPKRAVFVHDNPEKAPAMVLIEAMRGGAEGLAILPPLFLHQITPNGVEKSLSPRAQKIYDTGRFA